VKFPLNVVSDREVSCYYSCSRAVQDDTVVIEILPENEWACPSSVVLEDEPEEDDKV